MSVVVFMFFLLGCMNFLPLFGSTGARDESGEGRARLIAQRLRRRASERGWKGGLRERCISCRERRCSLKDVRPRNCADRCLSDVHRSSSLDSGRRGDRAGRWSLDNEARFEGFLRSSHSHHSLLIASIKSNEHAQSQAYYPQCYHQG